MKMQRYGKINSRQINICSQTIISPGTQIVLVSILLAAETQPFTLPQSSYRWDENNLEPVLNVRIEGQINFVSQFTLKMKIEKLFSFYFLILGSFENPLKGPGRHSEGEKDGGTWIIIRVKWSS